jgi:hypothetical protein
MYEFPQEMMKLQPNLDQLSPQELAGIPSNYDPNN